MEIACNFTGYFFNFIKTCNYLFLNKINNYKREMWNSKLGKNFYIFPFLDISLLVWLILSLFLWAKNFISNSHSMLYTFFSMFILMPYSMLILCTHNKISGNDDLYGIFLVLVSSFKLPNFHLHTSVIVPCLSWSYEPLLPCWFISFIKVENLKSIHSIYHLS